MTAPREGVHTPSELHRSDPPPRSQRRSRRRGPGSALVRWTPFSRNQALAAMSEGQTLHLQHHEGRPRWSLSNGQSVAPEVAAHITTNASVAPAGDALFADMPGQYWRIR